MINVADATPRQIAWFKIAAAKRYAERGIKPEQADQLFNAKMAAIGAALTPPAPVMLSTAKVAHAMELVKAARAK